MSDEINLILTKIKLVSEIEEEGAYICTKKNCKLLLDYITNLQQAFENSYTEEQLDFAVNEVKEQLKAEHQLTNQLHNEIDKLRVKNYELQQENERLKEKESLIESDINNAYSWLKDYKSRCEKAIESLKIKQIRYVNESDYVIDDGDLQEEINILQGGKDDSNLPTN